MQQHDVRTSVDTADGHELSITRTFNAPRELVWKAWTDPEMAKHWMGPRGFQATEFVTPGEVGSRWRMTMEGNVPGTDRLVELRQGGVVLESRPPELLVYTFAWEQRASVGLAESPFQESVVTLRLEAKGDKTILHFHQAPFATEGERDGHTGGWNSSFDRFAEYLGALVPRHSPSPDDVPTELHIRRIFAVPRQSVFDAWTNPEMMAEWWAPAHFRNVLCEADARQGGALRIHMQAPDGTVYPMTGRYLEVYPPYRLHFITSPLDAEGNPLFETWTSVYLAEVQSGTELVLDIHVRSSTPNGAQYLKRMEQGWSQSLDRLHGLLLHSAVG